MEHDLTTKFDGREWTVELSAIVDCSYQVGRYDEHGVARYGYAVGAPFINTLRQARRHCSKRFGIEATYRLSESSLISTMNKDPIRRLLFVLISLFA